jgi:ion channel-forming bestrophin family protein
MKFSMKLLMASLLLALSMNASTAFAPVSPSHTSKDLVALSASSDPKVVMPYGEGSRKYRRTFFTHKDWLRHRSEDRFSRTIFSTIRSGVVRQLAKEVGFITATAIFVVAWNLLTGGYNDFQGVHHDAILKNIANLELPIAPFTLSSPALGLLLGEYFSIHNCICFVHHRLQHQLTSSICFIQYQFSRPILPTGDGTSHVKPGALL